MTCTNEKKITAMNLTPAEFRDLIRIGFTNLRGEAFMDVPESFQTIMDNGYVAKVPNDIGLCLLQLTEKGHSVVMQAMDAIAWRRITEQKEHA